jgi:parallel beta-helix repeat protein
MIEWFVSRIYNHNVEIHQNIFNNGYIGLYILDTNHSIIRNNIFINQDSRSVYLKRTNYSKISNNKFNNTGKIDLSNIGKCNINNNQIIADELSDNYGIYGSTTSQSIIENNTLIGEGLKISQIGILENDNNLSILRNNTVTGSSNGISGANSLIFDNRIYNSSTGIAALYNSYIFNNNLIGNSKGIILYRLYGHPNSDSNINNNTIISDGTGIGIDIHYKVPIPYNNLIANNFISGYEYGVFFNTTINSTIMRNNTILNSTISGIRMMNSDGQIIKGNVIQSSKGYGLEITNSQSNKFTDNVFLYNQGSTDIFDEEAIQAIDYSGGNSFSEGGRGNYWRDLNGNDQNSDGVIDDVDYILEEGIERDRFPLESPPFPVLSKIPINITTKGMNPFIELSWEDGGKGHQLMIPDGYRIYRRIDGTEQFDLIESTTDLDFYDYNVSSGITYHYAISSFNEFGETPKSKYVIGIVDDRKPYVNIYEPWNGSILSTEDVTVRWLVEEFLGEIDTIHLKIDETDWIDASGADQYTFTDLEEGLHTVHIRARDRAGNEEISLSTFIVDINPPVLDTILPESGSFTNKTWIECIATGYDNVSDQVHYTFNINGENRSVINYEGRYNFTELSEGEHIVTVFIHDNAGFYSRKRLTYNVDLTPPEIKWNETSNLTKEKELYLTWTAEDSFAGISHVLVKGPDGKWIESDNISGHNFISEREGTFPIYIKAFDKTGNHATIISNIIFDWTSPSVSEYGPKGDNISVQPVFFVSFNEIMRICTYDVDGLNGGFKGGRRFEFVLDRRLENNQNYTITIEGSDLAGNEMDPFTWSLKTTDWGSVRGKVLDRDYDPVENSIILIDGIKTEYEMDGGFHTSLPSGTHTIEISASGYQSRNLSFTIDPGLDLDLGVIILDSKSLIITITGKVTDYSGNELELVSIERKGRILDTTDENGMFSFEIEPGTHEIKFLRNGYETKTVTVDTYSFESDPYLEVTLEKDDTNGESVNYLLIIGIMITILIVVIIFFYLLTRNKRDEIGSEE